MTTGNRYNFSNSLIHGNESHFPNFIFDNADINVHSVTGSDTFLAVSGIVVSTSENESVVEQAISRSAKSQSFLLQGEFSGIPIPQYKKTSIGPLFHRICHQGL